MLISLHAPFDSVCSEEGGISVQQEIARNSDSQTEEWTDPWMFIVWWKTWCYLEKQRRSHWSMNDIYDFCNLLYMHFTSCRNPRTVYFHISGIFWIERKQPKITLLKYTTKDKESPTCSVLISKQVDYRHVHKFTILDRIKQSKTAIESHWKRKREHKSN